MAEENLLFTATYDESKGDRIPVVFGIDSGELEDFRARVSAALVREAPVGNVRSLVAVVMQELWGALAQDKQGPMLLSAAMMYFNDIVEKGGKADAGSSEHP